MAINLNDEQYNASEGFTIFADGVAGTVENVSLTVVKKTAEDKENAPDYKLRFTDIKGSTTDMAFYHIKGDNEWKTKEEQITAMGKSIKHVLHAFHGADYQLPSFNDETEMLNVSMKLIHEASRSGMKFRVFANYGSTQGPKKYIQVRSWVPFLEPMTVGIHETKLVVGKIDQMVQVLPDAPANQSNKADANELLDGDAGW